MGPPRRHLDRLASQRRGLARKIPTHPLRGIFQEIVRHLSQVEDVHILVNDLAAESRATGHLRRAGANLARLHFHHWATDRVWLRDSGPIFIKNPAGDLAATNWRFNALRPSTTTGAATTRSPNT